MKVSVVVVTHNRERFMRAIHDVYARQTHPDTELLILDDSDEPSPFLSRLDDPRVRYTHLTQRMSIGAKRNRLIEQAWGSYARRSVAVVLDGDGETIAEGAR